MAKLTARQLDAAVAWWTNALRNPRFSCMTPAERARPDSEPAAVAELMATTLRPAVTEAQSAKFAERLRSTLAGMEEAPHGLFVDYHAEGPLRAACDAAGVSDMLGLPWKTRMWFRGGGVQVSCGYGADTVELLEVGAEGT